ncbi:MAG: hypothetical protein J6T76_00770 [Paludibacteraceae bacterium]|jgi:hypothetical protein|nr:hypothetical protein [Paludibacteraceae bacterium]MBO7454914.1 hypothetical protein [Paludibacteraceae bacterium]
MAKIYYNTPVENMTGALDSNHKFIQRQKHLRDTYGIVTYTCDTESYIVSNPRDYKRNPPTGAELAHLRHFGEAAKRTTALLSALKPEANPTPEQLARIEAYRQRFQAQLRKYPDPQAPIGADGKAKRYHRFDNFIRAMIYQDLKN